MPGFPILSKILEEIEIIKSEGEAADAAEATVEDKVLVMLGQILHNTAAILEWADPPRVPTKFRVAIPRQVSKITGEELMPGTVSVGTEDHDLRVFFSWADDAGPVLPRASGTVGTSDNAAVISAVDVAADDASAVLRVAGQGTANITFDNPAPSDLTDMITVVIGPAVPSSFSIDPGTAVQVPKGTPA